MENEPLTHMNLRRLTLLVVTALILYLSFKMLEPFYSIFAWALALGITTWPLFDFIHAKIKNASFAAGISVLIVSIVILGPISYATNEILVEISGYATNQDTPLKGGFVDTMEKKPEVAKVVRWFDKVVNVDLKENIAILVNRIAATVPSIISGSLWSTVQLLLILFTLFYFFRDKKLVLDQIKSFIPLKPADNKKLFKRIEETVQATIFGSLVIAIVQGTLGGLMFWFLGLPAPTFWGFVMCIFAVVPYLGAFVVWGPVAVYLAFSGDFQSAMILTAWGALAVGMIDNLLYPLLVGTRLRYHTLPVFFFMLGGVWLLGASGIILGPVTLAVSDALIQIWRYKESTSESS